MRIQECLRLRVQDVQFDQHRIVVRCAKNDKDRYVPLPKALEGELSEWLLKRKQLFEQDKEKNMHEVELPHALEKKYPNAPYDWRWQYVFPADDYSRDPRSGHVRRHHVHPHCSNVAPQTAARSDASLQAIVGLRFLIFMQH